MYKEQQKKFPPGCQKKERRGNYPNIVDIVWTGSSQDTSVVRFEAKAAVRNDCAMRKVGEQYNLSFKISPYSSQLIHQILSGHGFQESTHVGQSFNLMWTGHNIDSSTFKDLKHFQKINHFPNSVQLGRKDLLSQNIKIMQNKFGSQQFNFLPKSYVLPEEYMDFTEAISKERGFWIEKPVNSSQGNGIRVVSSLAEVNPRDNVLLSQYITNPFLVNGYKFDFRIYVLVTSYNPLTIYLYKDGLTRFATEKYSPTEDMKNNFMHLTNTSVNKKSPKYINSNDQDVENSGSMWTFSAMLRYLKQIGKDTATLMSQVEDIVIKTIISVGGSIAEACQSKVPHKNNCFELYGFDILIDENLKPWLLEVNLSPALTTDNPVDLKLKANLVADTLTLVGVECQDPRRNAVKNRPTGDYEDPAKLKQIANDEESRRGRFIRLFPRCDTVQRYGPLLKCPTLTFKLCNQLFENKSTEPKNSLTELQQRMLEYERMLPPLPRDIANKTKLTSIYNTKKLAGLKKETSSGAREHPLQKGQKLPPISLNISTERKQDSVQITMKLPPLLDYNSGGPRQNTNPKAGRLQPLSSDVCGNIKQPTILKVQKMQPLMRETNDGKKQSVPKVGKLPSLQVISGPRQQATPTKTKAVNKLKLPPLR